MKLPTPLVLAGLALAGCQPAVLDLRDDPVFQGSIPVCDGQAECDRAWQAAREWVLAATAQGLQEDSDSRIQTEPEDPEALDWQTGITVDKVPLDEDRYRIVISTACNEAINACDHERRLMHRFNRDMAAHVSASQGREILRVFSRGEALEGVFDGLRIPAGDDDLRRLAGRYLLPATVIGGGQVRRLASEAAVTDYLRDALARLEGQGIARLTADQRKILDSSDTTAVVRVVWGLYDADGERQASRTATYNLVRTDGGWKILSAAFDE